MSSQPEARLQRKIQDEIKKKYGHRVFLFKVWGNEHMMAGLPDLIGCIGGKFFGIEVKMPTTGVISSRQSYVHELILGASGAVSVCTSPREALDFLAELSA